MITNAKVFHDSGVRSNRQTGKDRTVAQGLALHYGTPQYGASEKMMLRASTPLAREELSPATITGVVIVRLQHLTVSIVHAGDTESAVVRECHERIVGLRDLSESMIIRQIY